MIGKNVSRNNLWGKSSKKDLHYKMYKSGKNWIFASLFAFTLGSFLLMPNEYVRADTQTEIAATTKTTTTKTALVSAAGSSAADSSATATTTSDPASSAASASDATTSAVGTSASSTAQATTSSAAAVSSSAGKSTPTSSTAQEASKAADDVSSAAASSSPAVSETASVSSAAANTASASSASATDKSASVASAGSTAKEATSSAAGDASGDKAAVAAASDASSATKATSSSSVTSSTSAKASSSAGDGTKAASDGSKAASDASSAADNSSAASATQLKAAKANAVAVDTTTPSYQAGYYQGYYDLKSASSNLATVGTILSDYSQTSGTMLKADGSTAWQGAAAVPSGTPTTMLYKHGSGSSAYWDTTNWNTTGSSKGVDLPTWKAGYAAYVAKYGKQINDYLTQVQNNVQNPTYADNLVNSVAYDPNALGESATIPNIVITLGKILTQPNVVSSNSNIFAYNATDTDTNVNANATTTINSVKSLVALALPNIQNCIMNQALSDARSLGGGQDGSITLPTTLTAALNLNGVLQAVVGTHLFDGFINSDVMNNVYLSIAHGIRTSIAEHYQAGVSAAADNALNGTPAPIKYSSVSGYTTNATSPAELAMQAQTAGNDNITNFVEADGYAWGSTVAKAVVKLAAANAGTASETQADGLAIFKNLYESNQITFGDTPSGIDTNAYFELTQDNSNSKNWYVNPDKGKYSADATGALNTIYNLYKAETNAIDEAKADFASDPNSIPNAKKVMFTNDGAGNMFQYDPSTGKLISTTAYTTYAGDYVKVFDYLQSFKAGSTAQADADTASHTAANTVQAGNISAPTTNTKTFGTGDSSLLSTDQLKSIATKITANLGLDDAYFQKAYVTAYGIEAGYANTAFQAGEQAATDQGATDKFKNSGVLPDVTDPSVSVTSKGTVYNATSDGTASLYDATSGQGEPNGTAFKDGYALQSKTVLQNAINSAATAANSDAATAVIAEKSASDAASAASDAASTASDAASQLSGIAASDATASSAAAVAESAASDAAAKYTSASDNYSAAKAAASNAQSAASAASTTSDAATAVSAAKDASNDNIMASDAAEDANAAKSAAQDDSKKATDALSDYHDTTTKSSAVAAASSAASDATAQAGAAKVAAGAASDAASDAQTTADQLASDAKTDPSASSAAAVASAAASAADVQAQSAASAGISCNCSSLCSEST